MSYRALGLNARYDKAEQTYDVLSSFEDQVRIIPP